MRILKLQAENIKRLSAIEITPDDSPVQILAGENEAGKSSVLDAIEMALGGEKRLPAEPVRRGSARAKIVVDLGDIIVTRKFTASGTTLAVTNRDEAKYPSPQALLDGLVGRLTFDPLAFATMKEDLQAATLRALAKVDTTDLELARKKAYDERTLVNRDVTQAEGALAKLPEHPGVGVTPERLDGLLSQLAEVDRLASAAADAEKDVAVHAQRLDSLRRHAQSLNERVERLRADLEQAEGEAASAEMAVSVAEDEQPPFIEAHRRAVAAVPDRSKLAEQVAAIEAKNRLVAENQKRAEMALQVEERRAAALALTEQIDAFDVEKADRLAKASFPVDGLGLDDQGVTWQGLPFSQASTAVRTRVSVAIGFALNPKLKVLLIRNGNDLGARNLKLIAELAAQAGAQVWIERIDGAKGYPTVVIEDGTVMEQAARV